MSITPVVWQFLHVYTDKLEEEYSALLAEQERCFEQRDTFAELAAVLRLASDRVPVVALEAYSLLSSEADQARYLAWKWSREAWRFDSRAREKRQHLIAILDAAQSGLLDAVLNALEDWDPWTLYELEDVLEALKVSGTHLEIVS